MSAAGPPNTARNIKVIVLLIIATTATAVLLLLLETPTRAPVALTDAPGFIRTLSIAVATPEEGAAFDCAILPDGRCFWQPSGPAMRLAVIGSPANHLAPAQADTLLTVLGSLRRGGGLDLSRVSVAAPPEPDLAAMSADLLELLTKKGVLR
jgi:hypothetical protein